MRLEDANGGTLYIGRLDGIDSVVEIDTHAEWQDSKHVRLGNSGDCRIYFDGSNTYFENQSADDFFWTISGSTKMKYHASNDCLGVGASTTSSSYSLYVTGAIYSTGNMSAGSDETKKNFHDDLPDALDKLLRLKVGGRFRWIDGRSNSLQIGFGAQSLNTIFPEIAYQDSNKDWGVVYSNMTVVNTRAIQQLNQLMINRFESNEQKIERLESEVMELKQKLAA
jgi:hypothetical protein